MVPRADWLPASGLVTTCVIPSAGRALTQIGQLRALNPGEGDAVPLSLGRLHG
jgi:hypothetical protein